jgi:hypothetical protein
MNLVVHNKKDQYDVYIGRPSIFGNPFEIGIHGSRDEVIDKYKRWLLNGSSFGNQEASKEKRRSILASLSTLRDKVLGCWCSPLACHGDVLVELSNRVIYQCDRCKFLYSSPVSACDCEVGLDQPYNVGFVSMTDISFIIPREQDPTFNDTEDA